MLSSCHVFSPRNNISINDTTLSHNFIFSHVHTMPVVQLVERPLTPKGKVGGSSPPRHYTHCTIFTRFYNQIYNNIKTHDTIFTQLIHTSMRPLIARCFASLNSHCALPLAPLRPPRPASRTQAPRPRPASRMHTTARRLTRSGSRPFARR